jgi:hypothetical protein
MAVFACVFGITALSLLIYYVLISIQMSEWEIYAYKDINTVTCKKKKTTRYYFENFVVYKFSKVLKNVSLRCLVQRMNQYKQKENNHRARIRTKIKENYTPLEFCDKIIEIWYDNNLTTIRKIKGIVDVLDPRVEEFLKSTSALVVEVKNSKVLMFKLYNLFKVHTLLNNSFKIKGKF